MSLETDSLFFPKIFPKPRQPSKRAAGLGIHRTGYVALRAPDPGAAAEFAVNQLGFTLAGHDEEGRYYLSAAGPDPYSLVYTPGKADSTISRISWQTMPRSMKRQRSWRKPMFR